VVGSGLMGWWGVWVSKDGRTMEWWWWWWCVGTGKVGVA
jgi:hypothetical protein